MPYLISLRQFNFKLIASKSILFVFATGLFVFALQLTMYLWLRSPQYKALLLTKQAQQYSPSSIQAKRLRAMATAVLHGQKIYAFEAQRLPVMQ